MAATGERKDPFHGYKFKVEVDGITRAGFREASAWIPPRIQWSVVRSRSRGA